MGANNRAFQCAEQEQKWPSRAIIRITGAADPNQTFHFIKNLVMTGGLLQIVANGAGAISIDNRGSKDGARTGGLLLGGA
jgi:hypothetical protein